MSFINLPIRAWGKYGSSNAYPIIASDSARVFIEGSFSGTTNLETVQPGGDCKFNLGKDNNVIISSSTMIPQAAGTEEDKSTWFVSDKKKYRVKSEERRFLVKVNQKQSYIMHLCS